MIIRNLPRRLTKAAHELATRSPATIFFEGHLPRGINIERLRSPQRKGLRIYYPVEHLCVRPLRAQGECGIAWHVRSRRIQELT